MTDGSLFDIDTVAPVAPELAESSATGGAHTSSLYRKYRPQSFASDDLFGQDHVVHTLRNAIALNRIAHAYLFCGPRGTGKTTTARLMAKAVNCLDPDPQKRPCNTCSACVAINRNATTDIIEIDAASNRGIDDIRDLRERVKYAPTQLKTKFYIIDEAHQITGAAANAFLKTLEEPPPHTKFILATTDPEELLSTIVSRCQRFDFRRISLEAMTACLRKVASLESIAIKDDAINAIARHATGSLRDGLGLLDQVSLYREQAGTEEVTVTAELVRTVLGISRNERVEALVKAIADRDAGAGLRVIGTAVDDGDDVRQFAKQILAYIRLLLLERAQGASDADATAKELAKRFELHELAAIALRFGDVDFRIKHAVLPQLPLELAFIDTTIGSRQPAVTHTTEKTTSQEASAPVARPRPQIEPQNIPSEPAPVPEPRPSLKDRVRGKETSASVPARPSATNSMSSHATPSKSATPAPIEGESPVVASDNGIVTFDQLVDLWPRIRADVKALDRKAEAIMQQIDPAHVSGTAITLTSTYDFHRNRMNSDEIRRVVEDVISRLVSTRVQITCVTREEAAALRSRGRSQAAPVAPVAETTHTATSEREEPVATPGIETSPEDDEKRISAVRNIFDADEVFD
jgi:DNA polymerase-3 subunit gamma/tau